MARKKQKDINIKNEKAKIKNVGNNYDGDIWNNIIIVCVIIIILCLFYILTVHITKKNNSDTTSNDNKSSSNVEEISYSEIIVGRSFSISDGDYLIFYFDKSDDEINSKSNELVSNYKSSENHLDIYSVDMSDGLNKSYVSDSSNTSPSKASDIKINGPTLIKFSNNNVVEYIEGLDNISDYLN